MNFEPGADVVVNDDSDDGPNRSNQPRGSICVVVLQATCFRFRLPQRRRSTTQCPIEADGHLTTDTSGVWPLSVGDKELTATP